MSSCIFTQAIPVQVWGTIAGAFIAGIVGLLTTRYAHQLELNRKEREREAQKKAFLTSILCEIETLWNFYMQDMGGHLENWLPDPEKHIEFLWGIDQDYFTIFNSNGKMIGEIENRHLRQKIITAYISAKSLIDMGVLYNSALRRYNEALSDHGITTGIPKTPSQIFAQQALVRNSKQYKTSHTKAKVAIADEKTGVIILLKEAME